MSHPLLSPPKLPRRRRSRNLSPDFLVSTHKQEFLDQTLPTLSQGSHSAVIRAFKSLEDRDGQVPGPISTQTLFKWLRQRASVDRVSPATLQLERVYINKFLEWCVSMGYLDKNPMTPIPHVPVPVSVRPIITPEQFESLKIAATGRASLMRSLMVIAWYTGARLVDISHMRWAEVDLGGQVWTYTPRKTRKSGRQVAAPLFGEVLTELRYHYDLKDDSEWVFPTARVYHDRRDGTLQREFRAVANVANIPKTITFHCFRHTRATRSLNNDDPSSLIVVADLLGLSNVNTLRKYTHTTLSVKEKAMKA